MNLNYEYMNLCGTPVNEMCTVVKIADFHLGGQGVSVLGKWCG